ncbi:MAG: adenylate kinase [Bacteroidota bacterium]
MLNLILFGPPGSGKGTQASKLVEKYNLLHISTGDLFRFNIKNETALGVEAKSYMDKGELVPDSVTINMLKAKVNENPEAAGFIFDGFPRTIAQAEALDEFLAEKSWSISGLLSLDVPDEELVKRLLARGKDSGRSDDQDESIIRNRIEEYNNKTAPVFDFYKKQNKADKVLGVGSIENIFERLCSMIFWMKN